MKPNLSKTEMLPLLFSPYNNKTKDYIIEQQNILKRNAVIDDFLNSLDNKRNNQSESNNKENKQIKSNEEDEMDDFFKDIKYLKKIEKHNKKRDLSKMRPKCYGRKRIISNNNNNNDNDNEVNMDKGSTLSFDNDLDSKINNNMNKIITPRCATNNNIIDYMKRENKKDKKVPKIDINNLKFRNVATNNNYFLTSVKPIFAKSECNIINVNEMKNNNFKWTNRKLLNNIFSFYSNSALLNKYIYSINHIRSQSHIGNRTEKKNINIINKEISNISPNLIAAQLYKNNSYFNKRLKRNFTATINKNIKANEILSPKNDNRKLFKTLKNNNINSKSPKNTITNKSEFRKFFNDKNFELNWINTILNNKNHFKIININKNDFSKRQLKLKLAELEINNKLKNDGKLFTNNKK